MRAPGETGRDRPGPPSRAARPRRRAGGPGRAVSRSIALRERERAPVDLDERDRQQGGKPRAPRSRLREGEALVVHVARLVVGGDRVDRAVGERRRDGLAVLLPAQRRRELGVGAEFADRGLVQVEVGRRGVAGDGEALCLGPADQSRAPRPVEMWAKCTAPPVSRARRMSRATRIASAVGGNARAGRGEWRARPRWRRLRRRARALPGAGRCGGRSRARRRARAASGVAERDRACAIGEGDRACLAQQAEFGHLLAPAAAGERAHRAGS